MTALIAGSEKIARSATIGDVISGVHHVAVIASDYERSKRFYTDVLGCTVVAEHYREARDSWKLDLAVPGSTMQIEVFSFPHPPTRVSRPEACGLRHLSFLTDDLDAAVAHLQHHGITVEDIRVDEFTHQRFTFFADPDDLPLELYERAR